MGEVVTLEKHRYAPCDANIHILNLFHISCFGYRIVCVYGGFILLIFSLCFVCSHTYWCLPRLIFCLLKLFMATVLVSLSATDDEGILVQTGADSDSSSDSSSTGDSSSFCPSSSGSDSEDFVDPLVPTVGPSPALLPSVSDEEVANRARYALKYMQQIWAGAKKIPNS